MKILIIKPSSFGDIIHALPLVDSLKKNLPSAHIHWLTNTVYSSFLRHCPLVDRTLDFDRKKASPFRNPALFTKFLFRTIPFEEYDLVIDIQCLLRSGLFTWASRGKRKLGLQDGREGCKLFYQDIVRWSPGKMHAIDRYLKVIDHLGLKQMPVEYPLKLTPGIPDKLLGKLPGEFIVMNPFSRGDYKRWRLSGFAAVIKQMPDVKFVLIGEESSLRESLSLESPNVTNVVGQTGLIELAKIIQAGKLLLTNDSGPMHLAVALGKPLIALFGASDPVLTGPYGYPPESVIRFEPGESLAECPSGGINAHRTAFSDRVVEALRAQINTKIGA
ncbi:MAG: glycosyltransferase family 9 protein [Verrucomicrobiota bacterium]|nr:glycosyltransferase family 9 protein [Verrucomicrobiota bacterium]